MNATSYKCPNCGAPLKYGGASGKMECEFCESSFDVETLEELLNAEKNQKEPQWKPYDAASGSGDWREGELESMRVYTCQSCGAELIVDGTLSATSCPYCDNEVVFTSQLSGVFRPDYVIPFKIEAQQARDALKAHCKGKPLLPKGFLSQSRIEELKGVYVPFWLYDADVSADISFNAQQVRFWSDSRYDYTETSHYLCRRAGNIAFKRVPVDGSTKMADEYMEAVEPFDYSELKDFGTAYLSGYLAEKYDVDASASSGRANERIKNSTIDRFASTVSLSGVTVRTSSIDLDQGEMHYTLMPVWMLTTAYKDKRYMFAMNGQTGRFIGELPVSMGRFWAWFAGLFVGISAVATAIVSLF